MRPKMDFRSGTRANYNEFIKRYPSIKITFNEFVAIARDWFKEFVDEMFKTGNEMVIPHGLGKPQVVKYKPTTKKKTKEGVEYVKRPIDWAKTKALMEEHKAKTGETVWKYVYFLNFHTNGWSYFIQWQWQKARGLKCAYTWQFEFARIHTRKVGAILKTPGNKEKDIYREAKKRF